MDGNRRWLVIHRERDKHARGTPTRSIESIDVLDSSSSFFFLPRLLSASFLPSFLHLSISRRLCSSFPICLHLHSQIACSKYLQISLLLAHNLYFQVRYRFSVSEFVFLWMQWKFWKLMCSGFWVQMGCWASCSRRGLWVLDVGLGYCLFCMRVDFSGVCLVWSRREQDVCWGFMCGAFHILMGRERMNSCRVAQRLKMSCGDLFFRYGFVGWGAFCVKRCTCVWQSDGYHG